jgi:EAL domain-containing protein (putative c-di-GMP-specific phosphodiesterase class I)
MDDFGTGYSSLSYLRSFPFDKLKIDKSFISGLDQGEESEVIVRAIAALGHSLGMATTAEGVETLDQLERLVADGCTEVQGYFFSPPCPVGDIPRLLVEIAVRGACAAGDTSQAAVA